MHEIASRIIYKELVTSLLPDWRGLARTVPELSFEKKELIPAVQQLMVSHPYLQRLIDVT